MNAPILIWPMIALASTNEELRAVATTLMPQTAELFSHEKRSRSGLRVSDAGRCSRELWAEIHGVLDLPESPITQMSRFDVGTLYGAWQAALFTAALKKHVPEWTVTLELAVDADGIPGHIDVDISQDGQCIWVVENKSTYWTGPLDPPHKKSRYQVHQACRYAIVRGAPRFSLYTFGPAVFRGQKMLQQDYVTDEWREETEAEYARLAAALRADEAPADAKPEEKFRCESCRYSACDRNRNNILETLKAWKVEAISA